MLEVFILLIGVSFLATFCNFNTDNKKTFVISNICFIIICIIFVLFAGLRTQMNDTGLYILRFNTESIDKIIWAIGANPLFVLYQKILQSLKFNGYWFIFITSLITETSYLLFFKKYAKDFSFTIFLFLGFAVFGFTMAAMKQCMSVAIGIWAIPLFLNKKYVLSLLVIGIAVLFHPYVFLYLSIFLLHKNIFDKKVMLIILLSIIVGYSLSNLSNTISDITYQITGDKYDTEYLTGAGINIFRFLFYLFVPVLSFINRDKIRNENNEILNIFINLSIIACSFSFISLFGGTVLIGRIPCYFDVFICLSLPIVLHIGYDKSKYYIILKVIFYIVFTIFYYTYYLKYYNMWGDNCFYRHITIFELFGM